MSSWRPQRKCIQNKTGRLAPSTAYNRQFLYRRRRITMHLFWLLLVGALASDDFYRIKIERHVDKRSKFIPKFSLKPPRLRSGKPSSHIRGELIQSCKWNAVEPRQYLLHGCNSRWNPSQTICSWFWHRCYYRAVETMKLIKVRISFG